MPARALARHAERLLKSPSANPDPELLAAAFADADVPTAPFIAAAAPDQAPNLPRTDNGSAVIADQDWVQLQTHCPVS